MNIDLLDLVTKELSKHDFYFEHSDDHKQWLAGNSHKHVILTMLMELPEFKLKKILLLVPEDLREDWLVSLHRKRRLSEVGI